jgi:hypothetical protein
MGMFDTVKVKCPSCKLLTDVQSKAGPCCLNNYHQDSVPASIAESEIEAAKKGHTDTCDHCDCSFKIIGSVPRVSIMAIRSDEYSEEDEYD